MKKAKKNKNIEDLLVPETIQDLSINTEDEIPVEIPEIEEVEEDYDDNLDYNDTAFKKEQAAKAKEKRIEICIENFDLLAINYRSLILKNILAIRKMYMNYPQVEFEDLYQEGLIALYQAIQNFDDTRGIYFGVYLRVAIANKLKCFCRNFLPHIYQRDAEKTIKNGKPEFKRILINVGTLDDTKSYLL